MESPHNKIRPTRQAPQTPNPPCPCMDQSLGNPQHRKEHSTDQCQSRLEPSRNFESHWSMPISGEFDELIHRCLVFKEDLYGPMALKVCQKFPPKTGIGPWMALPRVRKPNTACTDSLLLRLEVIQEPLPLRPRMLVNNSVVLVKRENGCTKKLFSLFFQGFLSKG